MKIKRKILQGVAFTLAVLLLSASVGFNVDFHYCSGELKSYNFFGKAESCHKKDGVFCPIHQKMMIMGNTTAFDCCENKSIYFQSDQDLQFEVLTPVKDLQFENLISPRPLNFMFCQRASLIKKIHPPPEPDSALSLQKNIRVWYQSFLC